jgi:hypothetical protein
LVLNLSDCRGLTFHRLTGGFCVATSGK